MTETPQMPLPPTAENPVAPAPEPPPPPPEPPKVPETPPRESKVDQFHPQDSDQQVANQNLVRQVATLGRRLFQNRSLLSFRARGAAEASAAHYQKVFKENSFQKTAQRLGRVFHHVKERALGEPKQRQPLSSREVGQLFRLRHQVGDRPSLRQVIRHEIHQSRQARSEKAAAGRETPERKGSAGASGKSSDSSLKKMASSGEGTFEQTLNRLLKGGEIVKNLPRGRLAQYKAKGEAGWKIFFANLLGRGSQEVKARQKMASMVAALYRDLFKAASTQKGMTLVSDFKFLAGEGKTRTDKFARILVDQPELLDRLQKMQPGDPLPPELLSKLGEEINYTRMAHAAEGGGVMTAREMEANLSALKSPVSVAAMARFETRLIEERLRRETEERKGMMSSLAGQDSGQKNWTWYFFGGDPRWEKEKRLGKPRPWIYLSYGIGLVLFGLLAYLLLRGI